MDNSTVKKLQKITQKVVEIQKEYLAIKEVEQKKLENMQNFEGSPKYLRTENDIIFLENILYELGTVLELADQIY